jgi:hypothetical protein
MSRELSWRAAPDAIELMQRKTESEKSMELRTVIEKGEGFSVTARKGVDVG